MAYSENPEWGQTFGQLALRAAQELGAVGLGDSLEASEEDEMRERFNGMLAKWSKESNLWREESANVVIAGGSGAATLPAEVRDLRAVRHVQSATYKRPLAAWNRDDYFNIPNRAQTGMPMAYYLSKQLGGAQLFIWPVPTTDQTFELDYNRGFYFIEDPTQQPDLPVEWLEAAMFGLAARCANVFGTTRIDPNTVQRVDAQASAEFNAMLDADRPDYYSFGYDSPVEAD